MIAFVAIMTRNWAIKINFTSDKYMSAKNSQAVGHLSVCIHLFSLAKDQKIKMKKGTLQSQYSNDVPYAQIIVINLKNNVFSSRRGIFLHLMIFVLGKVTNVVTWAKIF